MRCPYCHEEHSSEFVFCPRYGKPLPQQQSWLPYLVGGGLLLALLVAAVLTLWLKPFGGSLTAEKAGIPTEAAARQPGPAQPTPQPPAPGAVALKDGQGQPQPTVTPRPTMTPWPTLAATTPTPAPSPTLPSFEVKTNPRDSAEMVLVPAGEFLMGSDPANDPYYWGAESPEHVVSVSAFWIYTTEVTNGMYQDCAKQKACPVPQQTYSRTRPQYYGNIAFDDYPVIYVSHMHAQAYCAWVGGRLPTEAEWEKAARGTDGRLFPWGNTPAEGSQANFCDRGCSGQLVDADKNDGYPNDTAPVGSYPGGVSPYGALDMAGNVWEWVQDWFQPTYPTYDLTDPPGPASSKYRVIRGGGYGNPSAGVRIVQREGARPGNSLESLGFRCVVPQQ